MTKAVRNQNLFLLIAWLGCLEATPSVTQPKGGIETQSYKSLTSSAGCLMKWTMRIS